MNGVRRARESDWTAVVGLLEDSGLPAEGAREHFDNFLVIGEPLYACAGFEKHRSFGLLRSVAVSPDRRGEGIGRGLVAGVLAAMREQGLTVAYLLTSTAADYFARNWGFGVVGRDQLPPELAASAELRGACPLTAVAMALPL